MVAAVLFALLVVIAISFSMEATDSQVCSFGEDGRCAVDTNVGTSVIYEDAIVRMWNFTLAPGEMTTMHRHDCDYHFVALQPTELEVYGVKGERLFSFIASGTLGFQIVGDDLVQIKDINAASDFAPIRVPRTHAAKNIGDSSYYEILFEDTTRCVVRT